VEEFTLDELKQSEKFRNNICWDMTPKAFLEAGSTDQYKTDKYMLYVDTMLDKPCVVIMRLRGHMCKTAGYIAGIPEELLQEAIQNSEECRVGMYPLTPALKEWIKKGLGIT
jgi:hypothetical protein